MVPRVAVDLQMNNVILVMVAEGTSFQGAARGSKGCPWSQMAAKQLSYYMFSIKNCVLVAVCGLHSKGGAKGKPTLTLQRKGGKQLV